MDPLDELPRRHSSHETAEAAEVAISVAIADCTLFVLQGKDRNDYGTDLHLEARSGETMTNLRVQVQLKGTEKKANADGSVSVEIDRANLNYLLASPDALYVCHHVPSQRLLVRYAHDIYVEYERRRAERGTQETVTIRFTQAFDAQFQQRLSRRIVACGRSARNQRLEWIATPPDQIAAKVRRAIPSVEIPADPESATAMLARLYAAGEDSVISKAFEQFAAVLDQSTGGMDLAFLAEINLGINGSPFDDGRVREGVKALQVAVERGGIHRGSLLYCQGNGWLALRELDRAYETFQAALAELDTPDVATVAAQCCKNMGSTLEALGKEDAARLYYERALGFDADLGPAHFALGLWHRRNGDNARALAHLDRVILRGASSHVSTLQGWRVDLLFRNGDAGGAFREIGSLLTMAGQLAWVWPWCARLVARFGRVSIESAQAALAFWRSYLLEHRGNRAAELQRLLCLWYLRAAGASTGTEFEGFKLAAVELIETGDSDAAFLWDRVGHWAQCDGNWIEAEKAYRRAYELKPERYGYCLGTALNFLDRHDEALAILLLQAEECQPDAMSWFQVAVAREGVGDVEGTISAYRRALELDPGYELAWFNLGGAFWNSRDIPQAAATWREAVKRFPDHALTRKLRREMPFLFNGNYGLADHDEGPG